MDTALDFSKLFNSPPDAPEAPVRAFEVIKGNPSPLPQNALQGKIEAHRATIKRADEICKERAGQIRQTEAIRSQMMKAANAGAAPAELLIMAAELVKVLTGDNSFYKHIQNYSIEWEAKENRTAI